MVHLLTQIRRAWRSFTARSLEHRGEIAVAIMKSILVLRLFGRCWSCWAKGRALLNGRWSFVARVHAVGVRWYTLMSPWWGATCLVADIVEQEILQSLCGSLVCSILLIWTTRRRMRAIWLSWSLPLRHSLWADHRTVRNIDASSEWTLRASLERIPRLACRRRANS